MSIRIPQNADQETLNAFKDVEQWLHDLEAAQKTVTDLGRKIEALQAQVDTPVVTPTFTQLGDTVVTGDLRVEGSTNVRGNFTAPQALDGLVVAAPSGTGDASAAQRVVEVHGSLAVLNSLSAHTTRSRDTNISNDLYVGGKYGNGFKVLYSRDSSIVGAASETDAASVIVNASKYMANNGDRIVIEQWGSITQVTWTMKSYYGTASITSWTDLGYGGASFQFRVFTEIVRTGAATQSIRSQVSGYSVGGASVHYTPAYVAGAQSNTGDVVVRTTLTDAGADVTEVSALIYAIAAPS